MKQVILDGSAITTRTQFHDAVAQQLQLPEWYGRNLDALYDALSEMSDRTFVFRHVSCMLENLGEYAWMTLRTFIDAASTNPSLEVRISE